MTDFRQELRDCEHLAASLADRVRTIRRQIGEESVSESFGHRLRSLRARKGWTQENLAAMSGISVNGILKLENDQTSRPRVTTIRKLAQALDVPDHELEV